MIFKSFYPKRDTSKSATPKIGDIQFIQSEQATATYMWHTQRIPRAVAVTVLQPYARRLAQVGAAMDVWRVRVAAESSLPVEGRRWQDVLECEARQRFRPRSTVNFSIVDIQLFLSGSIVFWAMPVGPFAATVNKVNANPEWIPEELWEAFMADYLARVAQLENH
ncbi:hypothetical protein BDV93DRAFT_564245 [Ceratobasidium sp. AG-I]|nr:hypothetical protein BDV93DRAFT_564245 [Ceratobasidium sp. AG-I]